MSEDGADKEFDIAINGPNLVNCDSVVREAMNSYWSERKRSWHFHKVSVVERLVSYEHDYKVLDRIKNTSSHLPYME